MDGFTRLLCTLVLALAVVVLIAPSTTNALKYQTDLLDFGRFGYSEGSSGVFPVTGFPLSVTGKKSFWIKAILMPLTPRTVEPTSYPFQNRVEL